MVSNSSEEIPDSYPSSSQPNIYSVKDSSNGAAGTSHELVHDVVVTKPVVQDEGFQKKNVFEEESDEDGDTEHCVICLHEIRDRTILPCAHDRLCFECIFVWCQQSRKCPLCNAPIGSYLIHNFRSDYDYSKHYLTPLPSSPIPTNDPLRPSETRTVQRNRELWGRRMNAQTAQQRADQLELAISRRRWIYRHDLYALHVASNSHTRYRPAPTSAQFAASQDIITRATIFIRRELHVWINLDIEFLTTFTLSLMKSIDIRSESAVKLLAEFLDMDVPYHIGEPDEPSRGRFPNAEHFAHELYSYLRSPYKDLNAYDKAVQYEVPFDIPPPPNKPLPNQHPRHWEASSSSHHHHAESSGRNARREESTGVDSPLLRSPREAFTPTPPSSPSDACDDLHQYQYHYRSRAVSRSSPRQHRSRSRSPRRRRTRDDSSLKHEYNKDIKGKGKTTKMTYDRSRSRSRSRSRLKRDTWKSNRAENTPRTNDTVKRRRQRSVSVSPDREKNKYLVPPRKSARIEEDNVDNSSSHRRRHFFPRHENLDSYRPDSTSNDAVGIGEPSNTSGSPANSREKSSYMSPEAETRREPDRRPASTSVSDGKPKPSRAWNDDNADSRAGAGARSPLPADHFPDAPIHLNRGISIKGQAKLLAMGGDEEGGNKTGKAQPLSGSSRQTSFASEDLTNGMTSQTRQRKPSELLHAHLFGNSATPKRTNGSTLGISSSSSSSYSATTAAFKADRTTEVSTNEKSNSVSSENGRDATKFDVTPQKLPSSDILVSNISRSMSAREIMARTRAKLAKMRDGPPLTAPERVEADESMDVVALNRLSPVPAATRLSETVRSYLLKRLEEEKKKVKDKTSATTHSLQVSSPAVPPDDLHGVGAASEVIGHDPSGKLSDNGSSETLHVESEHRDLLASKEKSLKATLLLRISR